MVTDDTGTILERDAYDPWGRRRYPDGTDDDAANTLNTSIRQTDKGFTGHEHLEEVALIHMNGRIYDPLIARFMSADPLVQSPTNAQTYNRYSYVIDNPLGYVDPTGHLFGIHFNPFKTFTHIYNGITNAGSKVLHNSFVQSAIQIAAAATGQYYYIAAAAAFNTGVNGGDLGDMVKSAAVAAGTAYAFNKVGDWTDGHMLKDGTIDGKDPSNYFRTMKGIENIAGHSVVGCASSAAGGGSCGVGAFSAGMTSFAGPVVAGNNFELGLVVSVTVGGTTSKLAGGKFANGAVTGAYGYLFNDALMQQAQAWASKYSGQEVEQLEKDATQQANAAFRDDVVPLLDNTAKYSGYASSFSAAAGPVGVSAAIVFGALQAGAAGASYILKPTPMETIRNTSVDLIIERSPIPEVAKPFASEGAQKGIEYWLRH